MIIRKIPLVTNTISKGITISRVTWYIAEETTSTSIPMVVLTILVILVFGTPYPVPKPHHLVSPDIRSFSFSSDSMTPPTSSANYKDELLTHKFN